MELQHLHDNVGHAEEQAGEFFLAVAGQGWCAGIRQGLWLSLLLRRRRAKLWRLRRRLLLLGPTAAAAVAAFAAVC
eukprot:3479235-Alexandrium_andersonii.AAC.1